MEIAGVVLTFLGGLIASWRRIIGRGYTMGELSGKDRREAVVGFGLVVLGTLLTIIGIAQ